MAGKKRSLADDLAEYGRRSARNIGNGIDKFNQAVPPSVHSAGALVASLMPGYGVRQGMRDGAASGRLWREGNYADSLDKMADGLDATIDELMWFLPGGGLVRKLPK